MSKTSKSKTKPESRDTYVAHGWKNVHTSEASTVFVSTVPARVKKFMMTASKEKKVLATGSIFVGFSSKPVVK